MQSVRPKAPGLSRVQTARLQRAYRTQGDLAARERLIEAYLPLARALARRFAHRGEQIEDLEQVGTVGLIKAVDRFEPALGVDLAAFAAPTIVGEIKRHLRDRSGLIRVPRREQESKQRVRSASRRLARSLHRTPTRLELVAGAGVSERDLAEAVHVEQVESPLSLADDGPAVTADEAFRASENRVAVAAGMRTLHRRERQALRCRYYADMSQSEIARTLGISQTHASRLLASGLAKLRENLAGKADSWTSGELNSGHGDSRRRPGRAA